MPECICHVVGMRRFEVDGCPLHGSGGTRGRFTEPDSEHCDDCHFPVGVWWTTPDVIWAEVASRTDGGGKLCVGCFDKRAATLGYTIRWEAIPEFTMPGLD